VGPLGGPTGTTHRLGQYYTLVPPHADTLTTAVSLENVSRRFTSGGREVWALREVTIRVQAGEVIAAMGPSGSGKTTLLNLVGGLDRPTAGHICVLGRTLNGLSEGALTAYRATSIGLVFQEPYLLPGLSALENVMVGRLPWSSRRNIEPDARGLLEAVGLGARLDFPPARLSAGERQRVGIARALLGRPRLLLADEPTGNLDAGTTGELLTLLGRLRSELDLTLVVATHDPAVAGIADRVLRLVGGELA
jgi:ABC-type lipoprotein export system ATPase subunit